MRRATRLAAVSVLLTATAAVGQSPAAAAACASADGVTVVVDFNEPDRGVRQACVLGGGGDTAASLFVAAGHQLERVQQQPGFVCRVDGFPSEAEEACVRTPPANAYWGLWWSTGRSGTWSYASEGVDALNVPEGGSVALSWNGSATRSEPSARPPDHSPEPTPQPSPPAPTSGGGGQGGGPRGEGRTPQPHRPEATATTEATPTPGDRRTSEKDGRDEGPRPADGQRNRGKGERDPDRERERERHPGRDQDPTEPSVDQPSGTAAPAGADVTSGPVAAGGDGLPAWVAPSVIAALFAVAGGAAYLRRRGA